MKSCKYLTLLRAICEKERKNFEYFLTRLYANQKEVIRLYEYLKKFAPSFDGQGLTTQKVIQKVYKKKNITKKEHRNFLNLLSDLHLHLKEFLIWQSIRTKPEEQNRLLNEVYKKNNLPRQYFAGLQRHKKMIEQKQCLSLSDLYQHMLLNDAIYYNLSDPNEVLPPEENYLQDAIQSLNQLYTITKLKYACELLSKCPTQKISLLEKEIKEIEALRQKDFFVETPLHFMYYKLFLLLRDQQLEHFLALKFFLQHYRKLEHNAQVFLLQKLLQHAQKAIGQGERAFRKEYLEICQWALHNELLLQKEVFSLQLFIDLVDVALSLEQLSWTQQFIENYSSYLSEEGKEDIVQSAIAQLLFKQGAHKKSIQLLLQVRILNNYHSMRIRTLLLQNYYEINGDAELILREINNFSRFLQRKAELHLPTAKGYQNCLRILRKLTLQKINKKQLLVDFQRSIPMMKDDWLQKQIQAYSPF